MNGDSREQALFDEVVENLGSSLNLAEAVSRSHAGLCQLLGADSSALCVSMPGRPTAYEWWVEQMPAAFFARYPDELAEGDFVRDTVVRHPNQVMRDTEMVTRRVLERSVLYRRCRELGMPLEHVMSVLLAVEEGWHAGLTLYRTRSRPFSDHERDLYQRMVPVVTRTIRNCRTFGKAVVGSQILDALYQEEKAILVLDRSLTEKMRTPRATVLMEKWFSAVERGPSGVPQVLLDRLNTLVRLEGPAAVGLDTWIHPVGTHQRLKVTFIRLPEERGARSWVLLFQELSHVIPVPRAWHSKKYNLSKRELEVVDYMLRNWSNETIAAHLNLSVLTVKTHVRNSFSKLCVDSRADLMFQAVLYRDLP